MSVPSAFNLQPARPAWGIRPPVHKAQSMQHPIASPPLPIQVSIPVEQSLGVSATPMVDSGQHVRTGELIAKADITQGRPGANIHASLSGHVRCIEHRRVAGIDGATSLCIVIDSDGLDERHPDCRPADPWTMAPDQIIERIRAGGIVGLGGALFDTAAKLEYRGNIAGLVLNGAECEPFITCDEMLMRERADSVVEGALIMARALGDPKTVIAVESDMPEARVALHDAIDARGATDVGIAVVTAKYPAGGERQLVELITGREVPEGGLPSDIGYVCQNVATAAAVTRLFASGEPLISRIVTVAGDCVAEPRNFDARIGTPLSELASAAGGLSADMGRLIMGGPMMGIALPDDQVPVSKATNCFIALRAVAHEPARTEMPCIRCAECSEVCPARLLPQELLVASRTRNTDALEELGVDACIECGCCDYVCPSYIPLTVRFIDAKRVLHEQRTMRDDAHRARARFDARAARLEQESQTLARELEQQVEALDDPATIDAVMERVRIDKENNR